MSFRPAGLGARPGEYTKVNQETEVRIPKLTYVAKSIVFMIIDVGLWVIVWLIWARVRAKTVGYWRWFVREWTSWFALEWPWFVITLILCWIGPSAVAYLYRLFVEQIVKQTPQYTAYPAERGRWKPFKPDPIEYDMLDAEAEAEAEAETPSAEDQPYIVRGEMRTGDRSVLYLEFELEDYAAALKWHKFCQTVDGGANFSYTEAVKRHKLSGKDWKRIYKAFTSQHWATKAPRRGTSELMAVGKHWIKMYAKNPPLAPLPA